MCALPSCFVNLLLLFESLPPAELWTPAGQPGARLEAGRGRDTTRMRTVRRLRVELDSFYPLLLPSLFSFPCRLSFSVLYPRCLPFPFRPAGPRRLSVPLCPVSACLRRPPRPTPRRRTWPFVLLEAFRFGSPGCCCGRRTGGSRLSNPARGMTNRAGSGAGGLRTEQGGGTGGT